MEAPIDGKIALKKAREEAIKQLLSGENIDENSLDQMEKKKKVNELLKEQCKGTRKQKGSLLNLSGKEFLCQQRLRWNSKKKRRNQRVEDTTAKKIQHKNGNTKKNTGKGKGKKNSAYQKAREEAVKELFSDAGVDENTFNNAKVKNKKVNELLSEKCKSHKKSKTPLMKLKGEQFLCQARMQRRSRKQNRGRTNRRKNNKGSTNQADMETDSDTVILTVNQNGRGKVNKNKSNRSAYKKARKQAIKELFAEDNVDEKTLTKPADRRKKINELLGEKCKDMKEVKGSLLELKGSQFLCQEKLRKEKNKGNNQKNKGINLKRKDKGGKQNKKKNRKFIKARDNAIAQLFSEEGINKDFKTQKDKNKELNILLDEKCQNYTTNGGSLQKLNGSDFLCEARLRRQKRQKNNNVKNNSSKPQQGKKGQNNAAWKKRKDEVIKKLLAESNVEDEFTNNGERNKKVNQLLRDKCKEKVGSVKSNEKIVWGDTSDEEFICNLYKQLLKYRKNRRKKGNGNQQKRGKGKKVKKGKGK